MKPIKLTPLAEADIELQAQWYQNQRTGLDFEFADAIQANFQVIQRRPHSAPLYGNQYTRKRQVDPPFHRFSILYREDAEAIWVLAIWSANRNPEDLRSR